MIRREAVLKRVRQALAHNPVVGLVGPRQCGKTTLARQIVPADSIKYFDLEDPTSVARLAEPMTALATLRGVVVIDEVQHCPELFAVLRVLADRTPLRARCASGASARLRAGRHPDALLRGDSARCADRHTGEEPVGPGRAFRGDANRSLLPLAARTQVLVEENDGEPEKG